MSTPAPDVKASAPSRRPMSAGLLVVLLLALMALISARLSSPLLLPQSGDTQIPYGLLMVSLAALAGLVPAFDGGSQRYRVLAAIGAGWLAGVVGSGFLPLGGYDLWANADLYAFSFLAGIAFYAVTSMAAPHRGPSATWWGSAGIVAVALLVLSVVFLNARDSALAKGPGVDLLKGPVRCRAIETTHAWAVPRNLESSVRLPASGAIDLGPGPLGEPEARLTTTNLAVELTVDNRVAWSLRTPLIHGLPNSSANLPADSALLWAKWTDAGGVLFAVTRLDWRDPSQRSTGRIYEIVTIYQVGP